MVRAFVFCDFFFSLLFRWIAAAATLCVAAAAIENRNTHIRSRSLFISSPVSLIFSSRSCRSLTLSMCCVSACHSIESMFAVCIQHMFEFSVLFFFVFCFRHCCCVAHSVLYALSSPAPLCFCEWYRRIWEAVRNNQFYLHRGHSDAVGQRSFLAL